jgi:iron(III) transport system substrate-binding protein
MLKLSRRETMRLALAGAGAAWGAGLAGRSFAAEAETLVVYCGQHRQTAESVVAAFTARTGIKVTLRQGESAQLANQIMEEGANSPADVFFSEQGPPMSAVDAKGLLLPASPEATALVPAIYASADKTWLGTSLRCRVIGYNKAMVKEEELPRSILDIAQPRWAGQVAYVPRDGFQEQIFAIVKLHGREKALAWLTWLKTNGSLYKGNGAAMNAVENGEISLALVNNYYWFGIAKEKGADKMKSALHYVARGDAGALVNLSPAAVLKNSKKVEAAQKFLAFLVSDEGQKAIVAPYAEYPVRASIPTPFQLKPIDEIGPAVSPADIGAATVAFDLQREVGMI